MKKRLLSFLLMLTLVFATFGSFGVMAAKEKYVDAELLVNGDMELLGEAFSYWTGINIETKIVRSGGRSLKQTHAEDPNDKRISTQSNVKGFIPGKTYKYTAWMYTETVFPGSRPVINIIPKDASGKTISEARVDVEAVPQKGKWTKVELDFIAPDGIASAEVSLRIDGGGTIYWDDASIIGKVTPEYKEYIDDYRQKNLEVKAQGEYYMQLNEDRNMRREFAPGAQSIIKNSGFENLNESGVPSNWSSSNNGWGATCNLVTGAENVHSGNNAMMIDGEGLSGNPYASQFITEGFEPGKEYVISAWVKNVDMTGIRGAIMKFECYSDVNTRNSSTATGEMFSPTYVYDDHEWHQIKLVYRIPENTKAIIALIRMNAPGKLAYDDVEMALAAPESVCKLDSYRKFFYTEDPEGTMFANIDNAYQAIEPGNCVEFAIKDKNGNVVASGKEEAKKTTYWTFDTSVLAEKQVAYTASATYYDAAGNIIDGPREKDIYRYDRPKRMNENGEYVDPVTGKVISPSLIYTCETEEDVIYAVEKLGVTVTKNWVKMGAPDEDIMAMLDRAQEIGVKVCFVLYTPPAGHPLTIDSVRHLVTLVKDHPAVFGYMLQDEPTIQSGPSWNVKTYEQMIYYITEGYKAVRAIDPNNLVYCLECPASIEELRTTAQCTDVFMVDPYPNSHEVVKTYQILCVGQALEATGGEYKQLTLLKAAAMEPKDYENGIVTDVAVRHQAYQALWIGAQDYGYIPVKSQKGFRIDTSPFVEGIEGHTSTGEQQIIRDHFHGINTTLVSNYQGKDVWMRSWIDEKGDMYLVLMNMTTGDVEVDLSFVSENGKFTVGQFVATPVNGDTRTLAGNGRIQTTLSDIQVALYKVTADVDKDLIAQSAFDDMAGYEWAENAVKVLNDKDIINSKGYGVFAPAENITRADFAGFIIRTLGLEEKGAENFADVDPNHEYAKEIATGKALGIFNGTGDNKFEPDAPISRQDLMTMCYRGMKTAGVVSGMVSNAWINNFSDSGNISDYATEAIASMIENSIVRGNGDGTVNPLGNTTRAEAAVIMERISALRPDYRRLLA